MHHIQTSLARSDREWEWLPPILFRNVISVTLTMRRSTDDLSVQKDCNARNAAFVFKQFICSNCSVTVHGPLCLSLISWHPNLVWIHRILWSSANVLIVRVDRCKSWPLLWSSPGVCDVVGLVRWLDVLLPLFPEFGIFPSMIPASSLLDVLLLSTWLLVSVLAVN